MCKTLDWDRALVVARRASKRAAVREKEAAEASQATQQLPEARRNWSGRQYPPVRDLSDFDQTLRVLGDS